MYPIRVYYDIPEYWQDDDWLTIANTKLTNFYQEHPELIFISAEITTCSTIYDWTLNLITFAYVILDNEHLRSVIKIVWQECAETNKYWEEYKFFGEASYYPDVYYFRGKWHRSDITSGFQNISL